MPPQQAAEQPAPEPTPASQEQPVTYVKDGIERQAYSPAEQVRFEYDGWRRADAPPVARGGFLPPSPGEHAQESESTGEAGPGSSAVTTVHNATDKPEPVLTEPGSGTAAAAGSSPDAPAPKAGRKTKQQ